MCLRAWQPVVGFAFGGCRDPRGISGAVCSYDGAWSARVWGASRIASARIAWGHLAFLQPVADGIKSLTKEDIVPHDADGVVHFLAPLVLVVAVFMGLCGVADRAQHGAGRIMDAGLLFFFADGRVDGAFGLHGGVVEPQQVFAAGGDARSGADDQL